MCKSRFASLIFLSTVVAPLALAPSAIASGRDWAPVLAQDAAPKPSLAFVANQGQWELPARFVARRGGMVVSVERDALVVRHGELVFRLAFVDASPDLELVGQEPLPGRRNYFVGADRTRWRTDVPAYAAVLYRDLYDGVDLRLHEQDRSLKYDVLVAPGADLDRIVVHCDGVEGLVIGADGSLVMHTAAGAITQPPPTTWQVTSSGERVPVPCRYCLVDATSYGFHVPARDPELMLVIDPTLEWASFLGGSHNELITASGTDAQGNVYVAGTTRSADFPVTRAPTTPPATHCPGTPSSPS